MILNKLKADSYLPAIAVFLIDMTVTVLASLITVVVCIMLYHGLVEIPRLMGIWLGTSVVASLFAFYLTKFYRTIIRYSTLRDIGVMTLSIIIKEILMALALLIANIKGLDSSVGVVMVTLDFMVTFTGLMLVRVLMAALYRVINGRPTSNSKRMRVLVYGIGEKAASLPTRLNNSRHYEIIGFITDNNIHGHNKLAGKPIYTFHSIDEIGRIADEANAKGIIFAHYEDARDKRNEMLEIARDRNIKLLFAPSIDDVTANGHQGTIRKIRIEDLLGRDEIKISMDEITDWLSGKTVMVTGAAGSIGSELCRQLAMLGVKELIMFDNAETPLHNVRLEFEDRFPGLRFTPVIGDVRQESRLEFVFKKFKPQVVFHAAAYKHVPLMEENPCEAVRVNVIGSKNVADKCVEYEVERMVMVSTDKAVNPTNIMGCTKRLAEIYVQSLGLAIERGDIQGRTRFVTTRFGNVLGSNGSVIPRFEEQIRNGGPVTVTHRDIRRFFMTIPEACRLVMEAATIATGTQIFIFDMGEPVKIVDLARSMIELAGYRPDIDIRIEFTGLRPGEKLYEEVLATKENTLPTDHKRIYVAKVRDYSYNEAEAIAVVLDRMSRNVEIDEMVMVMKQTVPEFKSKNSIFEKFDHE